MRASTALITRMSGKTTDEYNFFFGGKWKYPVFIFKKDHRVFCNFPCHIVILIHGKILSFPVICPVKDHIQNTLNSLIQYFHG